MKYKKSNISWETLIPTHWEEIKGKYMFTNKKEIIGDDWINEQRISLTYEGVIPRDNDDSSGLNPESLATYQIVKKNDLLFKLIDLENEKTSRVGLSSYNGITSSAYIRIALNNMYPKYYFYWYYSLWFRYIYNRLGNGVRSTLNAKDLLDLLVPVPPKEEQIKISETIDNSTCRIDQLIMNQQQQIEKLKEYKQSLISEVVTKGLDLNVEMKDSGIEWIGSVPLEWDSIRIKDFTKNTTTRNENGNLKYIALENIVSESFQYIETDNSYDPKEGVSAPKHSVLFGKLRPYLAKSFYCENDVSCSSEFAVFPFNHEVTGKYFLLLTQTYGFIDTINMSTYGTKMPRANINFINNLYVVLPPFDEQIIIVNYLMGKLLKIDNLIALKNNKIDKLTEYKKSLIYEYVTGKKEIS